MILRLFFCLPLILLGAACLPIVELEPTEIVVAQLTKTATTRPTIRLTNPIRITRAPVTAVPTLGVITSAAPPPLIDTATPTKIVPQGQRTMATVDITQIATLTPTLTATAQPATLPLPTAQPIVPTNTNAPTPTATWQASPTATWQPTPTATWRPTSTSMPTATATRPPAPTATTARGGATAPNVSPYPRVTNRAQLAAQMADADIALNRLITVVQEANWDGELDCWEMVDSFGRFSLRFTTYTPPIELKIPYDHYREAVEIVRQDIKLIYDKCLATNTPTLSIWKMDPVSLYGSAITQSTLARRAMDKAQEWLIGDPVKLAELFVETRRAIDRYGTLINNAAVRHCPDIVDTYRTIVFDSPFLSPAPGVNETTYRHYRAAIAAIEVDGLELLGFCQNAGGQPPATPVPESAATAAKRGHAAALRELSEVG